MSQFKPYPVYKDSGVQWLGKVPESWTAGMLRWYSTIQGGIAKGKDYEGRDTISLPYLRVANVQDGFVDLTEIKQVSVLESELERYSLRAGDVLMNEGGDNDKLGRGAVWQGQIEPCLHQNHVFAIRPNDLLRSEWLAAFTGSQPARTYFFLSSKQSTNLASISASNIMSLVVPIPPVAEQTQVLRFLDHETARIDALIEEQLRLIKLLKEKRKAVISHAVTKGLDPAVPMKDSGVEWLGAVPVHWDVARVKNVAKLESGHTPSKEFSEYWEGGDIPWVSLNDSKQLKVVDYIDETQFMITALGISNSSTRLLPARAVVFTRDATIGLAAITTRKMCVSQHLIAWICNESIVLPEYLLFVFYAMEEELNRFTFGATLKTIGMPDVRKLVTTVPPLAEQVEIVAEVNAKRELIERLIREANTALELHSERRSALVSAAVTGKIDVRGWRSPANVSSSALLEEESV